MNYSYYIQYLLSGCTNGSVYIISAIGFNIIYNTTGIINFAQGEFLMLGGMTAYYLLSFMPLPAAIICAVAITAIIGGLIHIIFIRNLNNPSVLRMTIITIGLSILIREIALHIWDEKVRALPFFTGNECSSINVCGAFISPQALWILGITSIIVVILYIFFNLTLLGKAMRACASNPIAASLCGINPKNMVTLSFIISAGIGALGGCIVSPLTQTQYDCGTTLAIKGFTVAILGGLGNSGGAVVAGLLLGIIEAFSVNFIPLAYKDAISIVILISIIVIKPSGLFGNKTASALKDF